MKKVKRIIMLSSLIVVVIVCMFIITTMAQETPFGSSEDVAFAENIWEAIHGYEFWVLKTEMYPGESPHGNFLQTFYNVVTLDGEPYHVIIKDNYLFAPDGTIEAVYGDNMPELAAITVMVQREEGYDSDNHNWFYAKYSPDGSIDKAQDMQMAGRITGCISCHARAGQSDYLFIND